LALPFSGLGNGVGVGTRLAFLSFISAGGIKTQALILSVAKSGKT